MENISSRENFGSKFGIWAVAAGSAVGLGNIWRFPYLTGKNGGAAFIILYLFIVVFIGLSAMLCELAIGRRAQKNSFGAFKLLSPNGKWHYVGLLGVVASFMIFSFYSNVAGWTLEYIWQSVTGAFMGKSNQQLSQSFNLFIANGPRTIFWTLVFMLMTAFIVMSGITKGIEKYSKIMMPALFVIILILDIKALTLEGSNKGLEFLLYPDFSKITAGVVVDALGQAFFSLSLGMGVLITYGSYIGKKDNLGSTALSVSLTDTLVALLAGVMIFPAAFAFGIQADAGPGLAFISLPAIFQQMAGGQVFAFLFFVLLAIAALTSTISLLEVVVAYFVEELKMTRKKATLIAVASMSLLGILSSLSFGPLKEITLFGKTIFDLLEFTSSNLLLPIGGLFIVLFVGWFFTTKELQLELSNNGSLKARFFPVFLFIVKFIAPLAIILVFLNGLGLF